MTIEKTAMAIISSMRVSPLFARRFFIPLGCLHFLSLCHPDPSHQVYNDSHGRTGAAAKPYRPGRADRPGWMKRRLRISKGGLAHGNARWIALLPQDFLACIWGPVIISVDKHLIAFRREPDTNFFPLFDRMHARHGKV